MARFICLLIKKLEIGKTKSTVVISNFKTDLTIVELFLSISNFYISKNRSGK
jgi:hypothetical protein